MIMPNYVSSVAISYRVKSAYKPSGTAGAVAYPVFYLMKRLGIFLHPPLHQYPFIHLALVIQTLNSIIPLINRYPVAKY